MSSSTARSAPDEDTLRSALVTLKSEFPTLGIVKTHALLLTRYPEWAVSEKRTRKVLQTEGLVLGDSPSPQSGGSTPQIVYPSSRIIPDLDIPKWTTKVQVKYFDKKKGKGLIALQDISEGEAIWREDPFVIAPEWEIYDLQTSSAACGFCTTPLDPTSPLVLPCPASTSSSYCPYRFCNRLCLSRSAKDHTLLCPSQNPASIPLLSMARETQWMALHALAHCTARVLLAGQRSAEEERSDWRIIRGFAELGLEERFKYSFKQNGQSEPDRAAWKKAHILYVQAFLKPKTPEEQTKLAKILKKPITPEIARELFEYDPGFLRGLGRMSLNLEGHGGLYVLHSHLNHSCSPNVSVRHLDKRTALARITLLAKRPIKAGEELLVTYVNPSLGVRARRQELRAWGFGDCVCARCVEEAKGLKDGDEDAKMNDLAAELKAGLGVM
ncbi:putative protein lysine methyltransferase SET5 [Hypsizygus marmoreus]|uniref:Histone-lysine N-methyltransferase SET5 n=1 Tax=Hypsizygus marmoreus TaxID=39966 RepID=A0A369JQ27_HYPMA|nr:putative protein lysine methyltransferase SET5 [Hypsizygus marmoreus]